MPSLTNHLTRDAAAHYVRDKFGVPCAPSTLAKRATLGTGPVYRIICGRAMYAEADLDEWAAGLIGSPVRRASEANDTARAA